MGLRIYITSDGGILVPFTFTQKQILQQIKMTPTLIVLIVGISFIAGFIGGIGGPGGIPILIILNKLVDLQPTAQYYITIAMVLIDG